MTFESFRKLMSFDTQGGICIEILFAVVKSEKFDSCWMGKMQDRKTKQDIFWYGLTRDGKNAFDYPTFEEFSSGDVFDGKSLFEIWDNIVIKNINGCDPAEMIDVYLSGQGGLGAPL